MYRPARGEYMSVVSQTELHHDLQEGTLPPKKNEVRLLFLFLRVERPFCYILIQSRRAVGGGRSLSLFSPANGFIIDVTPLPRETTRPEEKSRDCPDRSITRARFARVAVAFMWPTSPVQRER